MLRLEIGAKYPLPRGKDPRWRTCFQRHAFCFSDGNPPVSPTEFDQVRCNCTKFPMLGNVIHSVEVFSPNVGNEVDEDEDTGNGSDDALPVPVNNGNDDNLDPAITLYRVYEIEGLYLP